MQNKIEFVALLIVAKITQLFGFKRVEKLGNVVGDFFFYFLPIRKKVVIKNLSFAFPEKSPAQIKKLAHENYRSIAKTFLEAFLIPGLSEKKILEMVKFIGLEELRNSINSGKGVILLTAHFGNWELAAVAIALKLKISMTVLSKQQRNPYVTRWFDEIRKSHGNKVANLGAGVRKIFTTLLKGGVVGLVADQRGPREAHRVKLFNKQTAVYSGASAMAFKSGAPVHLVFCSREGGGRFCVSIKKMYYDDLIKDENSTEFNQRYISALEKEIIEHPAQWFWMHNIWKY